MRKLFYIGIIFLISGICFSIIVNPNLFFLNIISTLSIWLYKVFPSIFTFYIISAILINTNILNKFIYYLRFIFKKLRFSNQYLLNLFVLSIFTGNPSSSGLLVEGLKKKELNQAQANNFLKCSSFQNPLFVFAFLFPYNLKYAYIIILVHILSNILLTMIINKKNEQTIINNVGLKFSLKDTLKSINNCVYLLLLVCSMMILLNMITFSITNIFAHFNINTKVISLIFSQFEISNGLTTLINFNYSPLIFYVLVCFTIAFNGLAIHLQVYNIISEYNLKYYNYSIYRIIQGLIAICLFFGLYSLIEKSLI